MTEQIEHSHHAVELSQAHLGHLTSSLEAKLLFVAVIRDQSRLEPHPSQSGSFFRLATPEKIIDACRAMALATDPLNEFTVGEVEGEIQRRIPTLSQHELQDLSARLIDTAQAASIADPVGLIDIFKAIGARESRSNP